METSLKQIIYILHTTATTTYYLPVQLTKAALNKLWPDQSQLEKALKTLLADGLIETTGKKYKLPD